MASSLRDQLSSVSSLAEVDSRSTPGFDGGKKHAKKALASLGDELADLQRRLYANGVGDDQDPRSMLLVLQGMDTSGKGGVIRRAVGLVDPLGLRITSFKKPTTEELDHDFLWRIEKGLPQSGVIGVFDRSHYEDVLICRVRELAPPDEIERRYGAINDFEQAYVDGGGTIVKCMLHISADDQKKRLALASRTRRSTGSTTPPISMSGRDGASTRGPTKSPSSGAPPRPLRGSSCRADASGTATGPSPR